MDTQSPTNTTQQIPPPVPVVPIITPPPVKSNLLGKLWRLIYFLTIIVGILVFVYFFLARPYAIGGDPLPELAATRFALAEKISYLYKNPQVGDAIIFANNSLNLPYIGIITKIENVDNVTKYTVRSSGKPINPWVISRDKILAHVYYPTVSLPKDEVVVSPSPSPISTAKPLVKKNFKPADNFLASYAYPLELTNLDEDNLIGFSCGPTYSNDFQGNYFYDDDSIIPTKRVNFKNQSILSYLDSEDTKAKVINKRSSLLEFNLCDLENGKSLIMYGITPGGGGAGSDMYLGYFDDDKTAVAKIPIENGAYFGCQKILAITNENTIYVECGAGDGGGGTKSIYRVGLSKAYTADLLFKCSSQADLEGSAPIIKCGTTQ